MAQVQWRATLGLAYSALGVIYGDIGTSPLYTMASIFSDLDSIDADDAKMGVSLVFWSLTLVVLFKYVLVVLHAHDHGEGGTFALYSLLCRTIGISPLGAALPSQDHAQLLRISQRAEIARLSRMSRPSFGSQQIEPAQDVFIMPDGGSPKACFCDKDGPCADEAPEGGDAPRRPWWSWAAFPQQRVMQFFRGSTIAQNILLSLAVIATAMVFGDGVLTPAVSVVGAVSGLTVAPGVEDHITSDVVIGVSCAIVVLLFTFQYKGTAGISFLFSPVVVLWLLSNAAIGIYNLSTQSSAALQGLSPYYIYLFFQRYQRDAWARLGYVMLAVTGCEAMFADLGHFNVAAITMSWAGFAYPCLVLTYLGQGAYLITNPDAVATTYWSAVPQPIFWPMLLLATCAGVVASQALISGCFSITKQAQALDIMPRLHVHHTSEQQSGQVYVGSVNCILMVATVAVIAGFQADPVKLGNAYGLTISCVMLITTCLVGLVMVLKWRLSALVVLLFLGVYGLIDGAFVSANLSKVPHGGWIALLITGFVAAINFVWCHGQRRRRRAASKREPLGPPQQVFCVLPQPRADAAAAAAGPAAGAASRLGDREAEGVEAQLLRGNVQVVLRSDPEEPLVVLPGIGLFYSSTAEVVPQVMRHLLTRLGALHQVNVFVCVRQLPVPFVEESDRLVACVVPDMPLFYTCTARYGYLEVLDHGQAFIERLVATLVAAIEGRVADRVRAVPPADGADGAAGAPGLASGARHVASSLPATLSVEIHAAQLAPQHSVDISRMSRAIERSSTLHRRYSLAAAASSDGAAGPASPRLSPAAEAAALRVAQLRAAADSGVVYYLGYTRLRMQPGSTWLHDVLYDTLYKPMLALSYAETEHWQVPVNNLVELGMVQYI